MGEQQIIQFLTCAFSGLPNIFVVFRTPECLRLNHITNIYTIHMHTYIRICTFLSRKCVLEKDLIFCCLLRNVLALPRIFRGTRDTHTLGENLMCVGNKNKVIYYLFVVIIREHNNKRRSQCSARDAERDNNKFLEENRILRVHTYRQNVYCAPE